MNGSSHHKDIYFQMDALKTTALHDLRRCEKAPFPGVGPQVVNGVVTLGPHNHLPTPAAAKIIIDTYLQSPITNTTNDFQGGDGSSGIWPHLDVGDPSSYIAALADFVNPTVSRATLRYFVPLSDAKGGHLVNETRCGVGAKTVDDPFTCPFYYFPGTVGWMRGVLQYEESKDADGVPDGFPFRSCPGGDLPSRGLRARSRRPEVDVSLSRQRQRDAL